jgi:hypothetical protein
MKITRHFSPSVIAFVFIVAWRRCHPSSGRGTGSTAE